MTARRDLLHVVEAAYRLDQPDPVWLESLVTEVTPHLDTGGGVGGFFFDARDPKKLRFSTPVVLGAPPGSALALSAALRLLPASFVAQAFNGQEWLETASKVFGLGEDLLSFPLARRFGHKFGCYDMLGFKVREPTGNGVIMLAALPEIRKSSSKQVEIWGMCAAHIGGALRLRRALTASGFDGAEAVLETNGDCAHAEEAAKDGVARDALRQAVLASERARGPMRRRDPVDALALWQAMVHGRWSLVEHFDTDGHRYLVAKRNDPALRDPRGLSLRERQVVAYAALGHPSKLIGYDLGIAPSTVSKHLTSAMRKLRVSTHAELLRHVSATTDDT